MNINRFVSESNISKDRHNNVEEDEIREGVWHRKLFVTDKING